MFDPRKVFCFNVLFQHNIVLVRKTSKIGQIYFDSMFHSSKFSTFNLFCSSELKNQASPFQQSCRTFTLKTKTFYRYCVMNTKNNSIFFYFFDVCGGGFVKRECKVQKCRDKKLRELGNYEAELMSDSIPYRLGERALAFMIID